MIVGRVAKDSMDIRRMTADLSLWLDPGEYLIGFTTDAKTSTLSKAPKCPTQ